MPPVPEYSGPGRWGIDNRDALEYYDLSKCIRWFTAGAAIARYRRRLLAARVDVIAPLYSRLIETSEKGRKGRGRVLTSLPESFRAVASLRGGSRRTRKALCRHVAIAPAFVQSNQPDNLWFQPTNVSSLSYSLSSCIIRIRLRPIFFTFKFHILPMQLILINQFQFAFLLDID